MELLGTYTPSDEDTMPLAQGGLLAPRQGVRTNNTDIDRAYYRCEPACTPTELNAIAAAPTHFALVSRTC